MTSTFWVEPAGRWQRRLKVEPACGHVHEAVYECGEGDVLTTFRRKADWSAAPWPETCPTCGEKIDYDDDKCWQVIAGETYYRRTDTGEEKLLHEFPPGAMYDGHWMPDDMKKPDGRYLIARTPDGHDWHIDSQASNCDRPGEDHDCWCRHGEPPKLTVNNVPEPGRTTCTAGAGSIQTPGWHGFLTDGVFVEV